jgi:N-methylhydantoinase B
MVQAEARGNTMVDPISLAVLWKTLISIADEMASALRRTAFSEAVREGDDFSTGLFDRHARLIAQGNCTPGHLGAMPYVVRNVLEHIPPHTLCPGDSIVTNDSFLGGGHFSDFYFVTPVFGDDAKLLGYVVNTAHHVDVGGMVPGSQGVQGVRDSFSEGIRVLPVKLISKGEFDEGLMRIILGNVRIPEKVRGDLRAQRNANGVGVNRIRNLFVEYGQDQIDQLMEAILDQSEKRARELIRAIKPGLYSFDDQFDDYGPNTDPVHVRADITIGDGDVVVDFSRSSDQVPAGINCYINYTRAYSMFAMRIFIGIDVPHNAGVERVIKVVARHGSFFNPKYPASSGGRATCQIRIFDTINGAMSKVCPERTMGAFTHWANPNFGGISRETGKHWIMYDLIFGGYGGQFDKDGLEAVSPVMNCANVPIEVHETINPVRIRTLGLIPDTGGAGRYRGGSGMRKDIEILADDATLTLLGDRHINAPYGIFDGQPGTTAETILIRNGETIALGSKESRPLQRGDIVSFRLAGAGGYGNPKDRPLASIKADIKNGYLTAESAAKSYGLKKTDLQ